MARFNPKTFSTFLTRMANRVVSRTALSDLEVGGVVHTVLSAVAREFDDMSYQMINVQNIWDIDTATGEDLDARARDLNPDKLERTGASTSSASVVFSRSGTVGTVTIPAGTIVRVPGGPEFATTAVGQILVGFTSSASIGVTAVEAGSAGNADPGTITQLDAVTGVETVTNPLAATGGQDQETDAQFRARIKAYLRSLPRGTPDALKFAVLNVFLAAFGRIVSAEIVELTGADLGNVIVYVDDGAGTIAVTGTTGGTPEDVVVAAVGGEERLFLDNVPLVPGTPVVVRKNLVVLTEGVDYTLNRPRGQITLTTALVPGDAIDATYTWYEGLIAEAQKIIDGDPADRLNYPGYRAAGTNVSVLPPTVLQQTIEASLVIEDGFDADEVRANVRAALNRYINGLGINGDVILSELIFQAQSVRGVLDVTFVNPPSNVIIGEGQLARVANSNIDLN